MTSNTNGGTAATTDDSFDFEDDVTFNLRRAAEERAKAADADCDFERRWRLEIAAIFARRAFGAAGVV